MSKQAFRSRSSLWGRVPNGFASPEAAQYVYFTNNLMKEERAKTEARAALARAFSAPVRHDTPASTAFIPPQGAMTVPQRTLSAQGRSLAALLG